MSLKCLMSLLLLLLMAPAQCGPIVHQGTEFAGDMRRQFDWVVLRIALEKTRRGMGPFELQPASGNMSSARALSEMLNPNGRLTIITRATSNELERQLLPIRIPIDRGILGYRILLVREGDAERFARVRTLNDLRGFVFGQVKDWNDVSILESSGMHVFQTAAYPNLFPMLTAGRFDAVPRAFDEAFEEFDALRSTYPGLTVENSVLLYYPMPRYFFVRKDSAGQALAARIAAGLEMMISDGSLLALFMQYKGALIERAHLKKRVILRIPNPTLPSATPLHRPELWYDPLAE